MNRAMRRLAERQSRRQPPRRPAGRYAAINAVDIAINGAQVLSHDDVAGQRGLLHRALAEFPRAIDCAEHWAALADAANMAETFATMGLGTGPDAERVIAEAQAALAAVRRRHDSGGSWTLRAAELDALRWLVQMHLEAQLSTCSYREFATAFDRTKRRMAQAKAGNAAPGTVVIIGSVCGECPLPAEG